MDMGKLIVLSGPSGCGKNTIYNGLCERIPTLAHTVSATSREPREGEIDGVDYYFISSSKFKRKVANDEFVEYVKYGNNYYGTLKSEIERLKAQNKIIVFIIEVNGAANIKRAFPDAETVFIMPPSLETLRERICKRGEMDEKELLQRLEIAEKEMECSPSFDHCVINDDLETCINEVYEIIMNNEGEENK